ncbi:centrosomal protein of 120 kDa [Topomyia yanbarensis]|uniref:centrosomal protein of 120 kDa n=1 Tax=Topomyia yanbarensis TaxID=2498891 RepID=UPI00273B24F3|nr:centrosomal protein of 120 kDa [Topomyia yanbarensis]
MEQPADQLVIVLHVLEAISFHRIKNTRVLLTASLGKNTLETDSHLPGIASTSFDSNLVWETDRPSVKRMKTENLPIKVECYSLEQGKRSLIGHLVLPLRSVPLLPSAKADSIKPRWYRLLGLSNSEWKSQKPEVQLMVLITDKAYLLQNRNKPKVSADQETDRSVVIFANPEPSRLQSREGLPIQLLEERGLLQVGYSDQECDIFLVKIVLKYAKQMEKLLQEGEALTATGLQLRYDLLGDSYPCTLERRPNGTYSVQEKIVINFRTSLHSLKRYFEEIFTIRLEVLFDGQIIGRSMLRFGDLIEDEPLATFLSKHEENTGTSEVEKHFQIEKASVTYEQHETRAASDGSSSFEPSIKCKFSLKYLSSDRKILPESIKETTQNKSPEKDSSEPNDPQPLQATPSVPTINLNQTRSLPALPLGTAPPPEKTDIESMLHCEDRDLRDIPRTFGYNLLLQSIRFNARPSPGLWQLSLYHPKADTPLTKVTLELNSIESDTLEFPNLQLQLYFSSLPDLVLETITSDSSKLTLNGPHGLFGFARLDNQSLVVGTKEKQAGVLILENQNGESIGMATIFCFLDEVGINFNSREPVGGPEVPSVPKGQLDDQLSYKMLEEQKQWMCKQKELFLVELKRKETAHLMKLTNEWKRRRAKEYSELAEKMQHVSALTAALEESRKNLAIQRTERVEQDSMLAAMKIKLETFYQQQLTEIRDKAKRMEEDLNNRWNQRDTRCRELEEKNDILTRENERMRQANERLEEQTENLRREAQVCSNLRQQVELLEQKSQELEKSKLFYKQQWAKMVREVHKMKLENEEQLSEVLRGKERRKKHNIGWQRTCDGSDFTCTGANDEDEMDKIHRMIFAEKNRQQAQEPSRPCCSADHCC